MAHRTESGAQDGSWDISRVAEEATWGCQRAARLPFLPTPPSHLLLFKSVKKQNLRQGRGGWYLQSKPGGRSASESSTSLSYPLPSPERWGNDQKVFLNERGDTKREIRPTLLDLQPFFFFILRKIWPIMSWTPARLQPRGPSCLLLLFRCLPVMEMVNILHAFKRLRLKNNNNTDDCRVYSFMVSLGSPCRVAHQLSLTCSITNGFKH